MVYHALFLIAGVSKWHVFFLSPVVISSRFCLFYDEAKTQRMWCGDTRTRLKWCQMR